MNVTINGEVRALRQGDSVLSLLSALGVTAQKVAVERNGEIVPRSEYDKTALQDGDRLEIVQFVGGG